MTFFNNPETIKEEIIQSATIYWNKYREYLFEEELIGDIPPITFMWSKSKVAGYAFKHASYNCNKGEVKFNIPYFLSHPNVMDLEEIIAHELAHIIQYRLYKWARQAHGPEFRYIMNCIGFSGRTYHYMNVAAAKSVAASSNLKQLTVEL